MLYLSYLFPIAIDQSPPTNSLHSHSQLQKGTAVAGEEYYNGMFDCLRKIVKNEGYANCFSPHLPLTTN